MPNHPLYYQRLPDNQSKHPLAQLETIYSHPINLSLRKRDCHPSHCDRLSDSCRKPWNLPSAFYSPDQAASSAPQISYFLSKISFEILKGLLGKKTQTSSRHICLCYQWHGWFSLFTYLFFLLFLHVWGLRYARSHHKDKVGLLVFICGCSFSSK